MPWKFLLNPLNVWEVVGEINFEYNQCSCLGEDQQKLYENSVQLDILIYILRKLQLNLFNGWGVVAFINLSLIGEAI